MDRYTVPERVFIVKKYWISGSYQTVQREFGRRKGPLKVGVWCAISRQRIIGPIFFEDTVNTQVYLHIFSAFVNQLDDE